MWLCEAEPPPPRDHNVADESVEAERADLGALRRKTAVGDDADRDFLGRSCEKAERVRTEPHLGNVRPVDREEFAHEPLLRDHPVIGQDEIEDEASLAGL